MPDGPAGPGRLRHVFPDDGRYDPAPLTEYKAGMSVRQVWSVSVGSGSGLLAPAVVNDAVYAATPDGSVGKFDLQSGRQIWKVRAETKQLSAGVGSDGTTTAVASPDGDVIAFDDTGKVKWKARATSDVTIPPVVGYGIVVVRSGDYRIQAFDANSGDRLWSVQRPGPALALRSAAQMVLAEGLVITGLPAASSWPSPPTAATSSGKAPWPRRAAPATWNA